jgi:hypothetical protein
MYIKENRESINISRTNNNHSPQLIQKKTQQKKEKTTTTYGFSNQEPGVEQTLKC